MFLRNNPIYSLIHVPCNRLQISDLNQKPAPSIIICYICMSLYTSSLKGQGYLSRYSDLLQAVRSGDRIPVGAKFSAPYQIGAGSRPTSGSFPGQRLGNYYNLSYSPKLQCRIRNRPNKTRILVVYHTSPPTVHHHYHRIYYLHLLHPSLQHYHHHHHQKQY